MLTPSKAGLLEHKVLFNLQGQKTNRTYKVELHIIGTVVPEPIFAGMPKNGKPLEGVLAQAMVINQV